VPTAEVLPIDPLDPDPRTLGIAADVIRRGGLVAFPTETVYGLGANALNDAAVARIYEAKHRDAADPLILHLAHASDLPHVANDVPSALQLLAERFWPGPLTIVVGRHSRVPGRVSAGGPTVAVRVPAHPVASGLIAAAGVPIAAPSANRFMRTSATRAVHVHADLGDAIDLILDGGPTEIGLESTVVAWESDVKSLRVLRPGSVPVEAIVAALRVTGIELPVLVGVRGVSRTEAMTRDVSPGLLDTHYAPRARLILFSGLPDDAVVAMARTVTEASRAGERVGILAYDDDVPALSEAGAVLPNLTVARVGVASDLPTVAHRLFASLRDLDAAGVTLIVARTTTPVTFVAGTAPVPGGSGLARAIDDRLIRAAGSRVVRTPA
jgi:L-threonylcarbamoyladenylate synthase